MREALILEASHVYVYIYIYIYIFIYVHKVKNPVLRTAAVAETCPNYSIGTRLSAVR